jgi:hypothetical protein
LETFADRESVLQFPERSYPGVKYHLGLLENDRQGLTDMENEKVDKQQDSKVNAALVDEKKREQRRGGGRRKRRQRIN